MGAMLDRIRLLLSVLPVAIKNVRNWLIAAVLIYKKLSSGQKLALCMLKLKLKLKIFPPML